MRNGLTTNDLFRLKEQINRKRTKKIRLVSYKADSLTKQQECMKIFFIRLNIFL